MSELFEMLPTLSEAGKILKETGGDSLLREGAKSLFGKFTATLKSNSQQKKLEALKEAPDDQASQEKVKDMLVDAVDDGIDAKALLEELKQFLELLHQQDPQRASNLTTSSIVNSKNVVKDVKIKKLKGGFRVGDG